MPESRQAVLYRMCFPTTPAPMACGRASFWKRGRSVRGSILGSRGEVEEFKAKHQVPTTPQLFVDDQRIGGSTEIQEWLAQEQASA